MVAEVTVVAPLENAPAAAEAPPAELQAPLPETAQAQGSEPLAEPTPETKPDPLAGLDPELLFGHPAVKDRLARETESVRRKSERDTENRINEARSNWVASGQAFNDVQTALVNGDLPRAQQVINAALANRDWAAVAVLDRQSRAKLADAKVSQADTDRLDAALYAAQRGTGTLDEYADTLIEVRAKAYAESVLAPQIETRINRENAAKARAAAKTEQVKAAESGAAQQARPTLGVPGVGASKVMLTSAELESIPTNAFLALPLERQQQLVTEAHEADRTHPGRNDRALVAQMLGR